MKCENDGFSYPQPWTMASLPSLYKRSKPTMPRVETEVVVDGADVLLGDADLGAVLVVGVVAVGDQRVEAVVAAGEFEHDQDLAVRFRLARRAPRRPAEQRTRRAERPRSR